MPTPAPEADPPPDIFIVYTEPETRLAKAIKALCDFRGQATFYCREEERRHLRGVGFREQLATKLMKSKIAILLLSRSFKWSPYCQAETGVAMALWHADHKRMDIIPVAIPPMDSESAIKSIPVVEGMHIEDADGMKDRSLSHVIKARVDNVLPFRKDIDQRRERALSQEVDRAFAASVSRYRLVPPEQELFSVWPPFSKEEPSLLPLHPSVNPEDGLSLSEHSIIENLKKSLSNGKGITTLALVGVSLKFSLRLIMISLKECARAKSVHKPKTLRIDLVHMDAGSHILEALNDHVDIGYIKRNFDSGWSKHDKRGPLYKWREACAKTPITVAEPIIHRIDYIPPRVGIMIDGEILYAGRCSFEPRGDDGEAYRLLVGEREYFHYTNDNDEPRGRAAILEFKKYLKAYKNPAHNNGVVLVPKSSDWDRRVESCIEYQRKVKSLTLISQSMTKFDNLVPMALRRGLHLKIYVQDPATLSGEIKSVVENLGERMEKHLSNVSGARRSQIEVYYFTQYPTFRAVLIGEETLAVQIYVNPKSPAKKLAAKRSSPVAKGTFRELSVGALRVIASRHSTQFAELKKSLVDDFCTSEGVGKTPVWPRSPRSRSARA